jgi:hypothetical protein
MPKLIFFELIILDVNCVDLGAYFQSIRAADAHAAVITYSVCDE